MKTPMIAMLGAAAVALAAYTFTREYPVEATGLPQIEGQPMVAVTRPETLTAEATMGKRAFDATCAACHGNDGAGKLGSGPPLVHKVYEPSHHSDMAFVLAVQNGVRSHHWRFGDMPAQSGLTKADVAAITTYVRELQRTNGIN
jgi:mono/diheme cytochrome c family protein